MGWQPIETAPKNDDILVFVPQSKECFVAWWSKKERVWLWFDVGNQMHYCTPSHWMPLPKPPK